MLNAPVIVSSFDKIVANSYDQKIMHNTVVHEKKPTYPTFLDRVGRGQTEIILNVALKISNGNITNTLLCFVE